MLLLTGIVLSLGNLLLVWWFRFLPLFDYPVWLYESHILHNIGSPEFSIVYELANAPVPNVGLTATLQLMSLVVPIEAAGKVFLSLCVIALPWSFRYCAVRSGARSYSPVTFAGFPFAFGPYFFAGQGFYLGLVFFFLFLGYVAGKERVHFVVYAIGFLISFLLHGLIFFLLAATLLIVRREKELRTLLVALVPAMLLLAWHIVANAPMAGSEGGWSIWSIMQAMVKPLLLFTKSYGVIPFVPLTIVNTLWLCLLGMFLLAIMKDEWQFNKLAQAGILLALVAMVLPDNFLNIVQPGGRLMLPAMLVIMLGFAHSNPSRIWSWVLLGVGGAVLLYNTHHFSVVAKQMQQMYEEVRSSGVLANGRFAVVRLDWPPDREWRNALAPSIDPLFGVPYYAAIGERGVSQIFGTSILRPRNPDEMPTFRGSTPDVTADDIISQYEQSHPYDVLVLVGGHSARDRVLNAMLNNGFKVKVASEDWLVLKSIELETQGN